MDSVVWVAVNKEGVGWGLDLGKRYDFSKIFIFIIYFIW